MVHKVKMVVSANTWESQLADAEEHDLKWLLANGMVLTLGSSCGLTVGLNEAALGLVFAIGYWGGPFCACVGGLAAVIMSANVLETTGEHGCKFGCVGGKL